MISSNRPARHNAEKTASDIEVLPITVDYQRAPEQFQPLVQTATERTLQYTDLESNKRVPSLVATVGNVAWSQLSAVATWFHESSTNRFNNSKLTFCEWGSGLGIKTCIASMLGWNAIGIDLEPSLAAAANRLSQDFGLTARFFEASYKPDGFVDETLSESALSTKHGLACLILMSSMAITGPQSTKT